jgi:hypothetical protein
MSEGQRRRPKKRRSNRSRNSPKNFWGDVEKLPLAEDKIRITPEPDALSRSLGRPPIPGSETIAEHYFAAVYDRAVALAGVLAAAGGMVEADDLD